MDLTNYLHQLLAVGFTPDGRIASVITVSALVFAAATKLRGSDKDDFAILAACGFGIAVVLENAIGFAGAMIAFIGVYALAVKTNRQRGKARIAA